MSATVILLNGTPSAGKSTLARALHDEFPVPAFYLSLDSFRAGVQKQFWLSSEVPRLFNLMLDAYLGSLHEVAGVGVPVIAEAVMQESNRARYEAALPGRDLLLVGVRCSLDIVREREAMRGDRVNGEVVVTQDDIDRIHARDYDVEVHTDSEITSESVRRIIECWEARQAHA